MTTVDAFCHADQMRRGALVGELRGVLDEKDGAFASIISRTRGGEVAAKNVALLDAVIGEKPIGRFRVRPVLACERNALAHAVTHLAQELTKSSTKTYVFESGFVDLALRPVVERSRIAPLVEAAYVRRMIKFPAS